MCNYDNDDTSDIRAQVFVIMIMMILVTLWPIDLCIDDSDT